MKFFSDPQKMKLSYF